MKTITINVKVKILLANSDNYQTTNLIDDQILEVLDNDTLGVEPTIIDNINTSTFTLGTISIELDNTLKFTPNGTIGTSSFTYTIKDDIDRTSAANVIISTLVL